jgi:hypothetical protein
MHRQLGVLSAVLVTLAASTSLAQSRTEATAGIARGGNGPRLVAAKKAPAPQAPAKSGNQPAFELHGGIASGDGPYDLGLALGGAATWKPQGWPVDIRGDLYFAHHGGGQGPVDLSLNIFGVSGHVIYRFPTTNSSVKPYVLGGLGIFYSNVTVDYNNNDLDLGAYDSSTDLGILLGGGLDFTPKLGAEIRFMDVNGFSTFPILLVIHL